MTRLSICSPSAIADDSFAAGGDNLADARLATSPHANRPKRCSVRSS